MTLYNEQTLQAFLLRSIGQHTSDMVRRKLKCVCLTRRNQGYMMEPSMIINPQSSGETRGQFRVKDGKRQQPRHHTLN